jgi:hypothetical protein
MTVSAVLKWEKLYERTSMGKKMFAFRNNVVKLFGLKTGEENGKIPAAKILPVSRRSDRAFKVFGKTNNEIILGEDDKHLDFRVSLLYDNAENENKGNSLTISTTVKFHNWLGVLYFFPCDLFIS